VSDVAYISKIHIERKVGPLRFAYLPGESQPVVFSVHGAIAEHYGTFLSHSVRPLRARNSH